MSEFDVAVEEFDDDRHAEHGTEAIQGATGIMDSEFDTDEDDAALTDGQQLLVDAEAKLAAVEKALARLDSGQYGRCEICDEVIPGQLLAEQPGRTRCGAHTAATA